MSGLYKYKGLVKNTGLVKGIGLVLGKGLIRVFEAFGTYYQWLFPGKTGQIYQDVTDIIAKNYGTGLVNGLIKNVQVATFDGVITIGFDDLTGITITSSIGTGTPSINGNNIEVTAGWCVFTLSTGDIFWGQESNGLKLYGTKGLVGTLSDNTGVWSNRIDTITFDALSIYGYSVYAEVGDEENSDKWHYVIYANGQPQVIDIPVGYSFSHNVAPNAGFSNVGTELDWVNADVGLQALATAYSNPNPVTFDQLKAIDLELIPKADFYFKLSNNERVITNFAAQPYELLQDSLLSGLKDSESDALNAIKDF